MHDTRHRAVHLDPVTHVGGACGEARVPEQVGDVGGPTGRVVIDAQHVVALLEQPTTQPRPQEAGPTGHDDDSFNHEQAFLNLTRWRAAPQRECGTTRPPSSAGV
jgi:hypothetical protein